MTFDLTTIRVPRRIVSNRSPIELNQADSSQKKTDKLPPLNKLGIMFETRLKKGLFFLLKTNRDGVLFWPLFEVISNRKMACFEAIISLVLMLIYSLFLAASHRLIFPYYIIHTYMTGT